MRARFAAGPSRSSSGLGGRSPPGGPGRGRSPGGPAGSAPPRRRPAAAADGSVESSDLEAKRPRQAPRCRQPGGGATSDGPWPGDVEGGSCRPQRHPRLDRLDECETSCGSESSVSVNLHPGPPECWGVEHPKPLGGPGWLFSRSQRVWAAQLGCPGRSSFRRGTLDDPGASPRPRSRPRGRL